MSPFYLYYLTLFPLKSENVSIFILILHGNNVRPLEAIVTVSRTPIQGVLKISIQTQLAYFQILGASRHWMKLQTSKRTGDSSHMQRIKEYVDRRKGGTLSDPHTHVHTHTHTNVHQD